MFGLETVLGSPSTRTPFLGSRGSAFACRSCLTVELFRTKSRTETTRSSSPTPAWSAAIARLVTTW